MNHSNNSNNNLTTNSSKTSEQSQNGGGGGGGGYHHLQNGGGGGNINGISASMANKLNLATAAAMALTNGHHHHPHHHYNNNSGDEYVGSGYNKHHHHHHQQHHHQQHHHHQLHHQQQQQQHHMMPHNQQHPQWYDIEIKGLVKNISPKLWQWTHLMRLCLNDNNLVRLPPLVSNLVNLQYLDLSNNKIRTLPAEIGDMTCLRELYLNYNQLRVLPFELGKLFKLHQLGLKGNPLTTDIMQIYSEPNGTSKLLISLLDQLSITCSPPPRRPWMILAEPNPSANSCIFTTMCYNVLCDKYATRQYYGYCPAWALAWDYRKKLILDEIKNFNADIICLQELETEQFYQYFLPELKVCDYDGIFSAKSRAKTMSEQDKKHVDGCAIFFKTTRFQLVKDYLIEFNQIAMAAAEGSEDMLNRVMTKDNIGLAALLEVKQDDSSKVEGTSGNTTNPTTNNTSSSSSTGSNTTSSSSSSPNSINKQLLLVSTAHIHWDPEYCDVKLIQTLMFTNELRGIIEQAAREFQPQRYMVSSNGSNGNSNAVDCSNCIPLVVCADLNSLPESGVIEYLRTGRILANHVDFKDLGYDSCLQRINTSDRPSELSHNLKLDCAYDKDLMPYTNYTYDFKGMIDYIFYSSQLMRTVGLLGPLDSDWIKGNKIVGFPHPHVPSDHLPLMVELELVNPNLSAMNANSYFGSSSCSSSSSLSFNSGYQQSSSGSNLRSALPHHHQQHSNSTNQPSASLLSSSPSSLNSSNLSNSNNILSTNNFNYMRK